MVLVAQEHSQDETMASLSGNFSSNSISIFNINSSSWPWQNGRTEQKDFRARSLDALPEQSCASSAPRYGMPCCQESTVQPFRLLLSPASVRLPADLTSDDVYAPDPAYGHAATGASFEGSVRSHHESSAEVSIRDRIEDSVRARPRTQTVLRADDVIMVWKTNPTPKRGRWVGPGVCNGTHRGSVWVNMRGSLWQCSQLQCKLATTEESRGLEIQNQLLDDMKAEFQQFPGRRVYTDVEREGIPPSVLTVHQWRLEPFNRKKTGPPH